MLGGEGSRGEEGAQHGDGELKQPGSSENEGEAFRAKSPGPHLCCKGGLLRAGLGLLHMENSLQVQGHTQQGYVYQSKGMAQTRSRGWAERPEGAQGWNTR